MEPLTTETFFCLGNLADNQIGVKTVRGLGIKQKAV